VLPPWDQGNKDVFVEDFLFGDSYMYICHRLLDIVDLEHCRTVYL